MSLCLTGGQDFDNCSRLDDPDFVEIPKNNCLSAESIHNCRAKCTCQCIRCEICKKMGKNCE